jgi:hypothetical protein
MLDPDSNYINLDPKPWGQVAQGRATLHHLSANEKTAGLARMLDQVEPLFNRALSLANGKKYAEAENVLDRY